MYLVISLESHLPLDLGLELLHLHHLGCLPVIVQTHLVQLLVTHLEVLDDEPAIKIVKCYVFLAFQKCSVFCQAQGQGQGHSQKSNVKRQN